MNLRLPKWLLIHPISRICGLLLVGIPAYCVYPGFPLTSLAVGGFIGWLVGPTFLASHTTRRAVIFGGLAGFVLAYIGFLTVFFAACVFDNSAAGRAWKDLPHALFVEAPILAGFIAYGGAGIGWLLIQLRSGLDRLKLSGSKDVHDNRR